MYLKFCGFKRKEDVLKVIELPIDAIGFIHFPNSHRHRDMSQIQQLTKLVPSYIDRVVVLVNPDRSSGISQSRSNTNPKCYVTYSNQHNTISWQRTDRNH